MVQADRNAQRKRQQHLRQQREIDLRIQRVQGGAVLPPGDMNAAGNMMDLLPPEALQAIITLGRTAFMGCAIVVMASTAGTLYIIYAGAKCSYFTVQLVQGTYHIARTLVPSVRWILKPIGRLASRVWQTSGRVLACVPTPIMKAFEQAKILREIYIQKHEDREVEREVAGAEASLQRQFALQEHYCSTSRLVTVSEATVSTTTTKSADSIRLHRTKDGHQRQSRHDSSKLSGAQPVIKVCKASADPIIVLTLHVLTSHCAASRDCEAYLHLFNSSW